MAAKKKKKKLGSKRKGSKKTNKKLLAIIGVAGLAIIVTVGLLVVLVVLPSAERNMSRGEDFIASGEYNKARKAIGRAVNKEPSNLVYIHKFREVLTKITPVTPEEAYEFYSLYLSTFAQEARYNPTDIDVQLMLVEEFFKAAHLTGQGIYWRDMLNAIDTALERIALDHPRKHELVLYRGLALLHINNTSMLKEVDDEGNTRFPGEDDIQAVLEADPNNSVAWAALAHGRMAVYYRLKDEGRTQQAKKSRAYADETMNKAIEIAGSSLEVAEANLREVWLRRASLQQEYLSHPNDVSKEQILASSVLVEESRGRLVAAYDPAKHYIWAGEVVSLLVGTGKGGRDLAIDLLKRHVVVHPNDFGRQLYMASMMHDLKRFEEAEETAQIVLDAKQQTVSLEAIEQYKLRPAACQLLVQIATQQASLAEEDDQRHSLIEKAKQYREVLADLLSNNEDSSQVIYVDGIIALADHRYEEAAIKLEEFLRRNSQAPAQVYREAAFALAESGARGIASERLAAAIQREPGNLANYILKARIELMMSQYEAAEATLSGLTADARKNPSVQELLDLIEFQKGTEDRFTDPTLAIIKASERATSLKEYDSAIALLQKAIDSSSKSDWRMFAAMSNVYIAMRDMKEAIVWLQKAIDLNPDSAPLKNAMIVLENDDVVSATIAYVESWDKSESFKAESLAVMLYEEAMKKFGESHRWLLMGNDVEANALQLLGDRALKESEKYQAIAKELGADMTRIVQVQFDQAILDKDLDQAAQILDELSKVTDNELELSGAKVKLHLAKASIAKAAKDSAAFTVEINQALLIAQKMTESVPFSDIAWRTLGVVHNTAQEYPEALEAYAEAFRIAPENLENIRRYAGLLVITQSNPQRLLGIIRRAREQYPQNKQILLVWLEIEDSIGEKWKVFTHRFEQFKIKPEDRINSLNLALFLINNEPSRDLLREPNGAEKFSPRAWTQLKPDDRAEILTQKRKKWDELIAAIIERTSQAVDQDISTAILHATVVKENGQMDDASTIWDQFIQSRKETGEYTAAVIAGADFLRQAERIDQAIAMLSEARSAQSSRLEIDAALGSLYYIIGASEKAAEALEAVVEATGDQIIHARYIETLALSGQFAKAEHSLKSFASNNTAYSQTMLQALISRVKSEQLIVEEDVNAAMVELLKYRSALRTAMELDLNNPVPFIRIVRSLLNEYKLTQDSALLDEALQIVTDGASHHKDSEEFAIVETDVFLANGQLLRAIDLLSAFIKQNPTAGAVRQRLVEAYLNTEQVDKALAVVKEGDDVDPAEAIWHYRLGDLYLRANDDHARAAMAYLNALQRDPSARILLTIDEVTRTDQSLPDRALIAMAQGSAARLHPIVGAIEAKALMNLGRRRDALQAMTKSWQAFELGIGRGWFSASSVSNWFIDLRQIFDKDPEAGEKFVLDLAGGSLSPHQFASLAGYWYAFGPSYLEKALQIISDGLETAEVASDSWKRLLMLKGGYMVDAGRYAESEKAFRQLAEEESSPLVLNNLAYVVGVYQNQPEEGLKLAKEAVAQAPRSPSIIDTVAEMYERSGDPRRAAETLEFLLQIDPANALAMARIAVLYIDELNQPQRAIAIAERARSQSPRSPEVLDALGWCYYRTGKEAKGEDYIRRSLQRGMTFGAYLHLAQIVMDNSEYDKALDHLRMAQELAQDEYSVNSIKVIQDDIRKIQASVGE